MGKGSFEPKQAGFHEHGLLDLAVVGSFLYVPIVIVVRLYFIGILSHGAYITPISTIFFCCFRMRKYKKKTDRLPVSKEVMEHEVIIVYI